MKKLLLLVAALVITSCVPPEGCHYERVDTGRTRTIITERQTYNGYQTVVEERPVYESVLVCDNY